MSLEYSPRIITDGLVLCLDASDIKSYSGSGTTWFDRSGNGKNGTLTNNPTFNTENKGSLSFDGVNDYVTCGPVLNFGGPNSIGTILVWLKGVGPFFSNRRTDSTHGWIQCNIDSQRLFVYIDARSYTPYGEVFAAELSSTPFLSLSQQWNLCSIRINRPLNQYSVGINDYFTSYTRSFSVTDYFNFDTIEIGRMDNFFYGTSYFNGQIAQVNVYNRFLSNQEIKQNFNSTKGRYRI